MDIDLLAADVLWRLDAYVNELQAAARERPPHAARAAPPDGAATTALPASNGPVKAVAQPSMGVNGGDGVNGRGASGGGASAGGSGGGGTSGGIGGGGGEAVAHTPVAEGEGGKAGGPYLAASTSSSGAAQPRPELPPPMLVGNLPAATQCARVDLLPAS